MSLRIARSAAALALLAVASCSSEGGSLPPRLGPIDIELPSSTPTPGATPLVAEYCEPEIAPDTTDLVIDARGEPGTIDETFDPEFRGGVYTVRAIAEQPDGKILYAGQETEGAICRLERDGRSDPTFGDGGCAGSGSASSIAVDEVGRILISGSHAGDLAVIRFTSDGHVDETFGSDGVVAFDIDDAYRFRVLAAGSKVLVSVASSAGGFLAQLNHDGTLDTSFASGGFHSRVAVFARLSDCGLAVQYDSIRVLGMNGVVDESFGPLAPGGPLGQGRSGDLFVPRDSALARYTRSGSLVSTHPLGWTWAQHIAFDERDRLVRLGDVWVPDAYIAFRVSRHLPDGSPDPEFGEDGSQVFNGGSQMFQLLVLRDGRYLVAGTHHDSSPTLVRIWN